MEQDWLNTISQWEEYVLKYVEVPDGDDQLIRVPLRLAHLMRLDYDDSNDGTVTVISSDYKTALFHQGHVSNYILFLTILGEPYLRQRDYLIEKLFEYVTNHLEQFKEWKSAYWFKELISKKITLSSFLPLVTKWKFMNYKSLESREYQYILPLYLLLGNHEIIPDGLTVSRIAYNGMIISTCHIGDGTWNENVCDVSLSRLAFQDIISQIDRIFYMPTKTIKVSGLSVTLKQEKKHTPTSVLVKRAGDLLSFGAYITLLSKYARFSLPLGETPILIKQEMATYLGKVQRRLFSYNQERTKNGRIEGE